MHRINIIASCANRKRQVPVVLLRDIPSVDVAERSTLWLTKLRQVLDSIPTGNLLSAEDLYVGNYWSLVKQLREHTDPQEIQTRLWVLSAGYGLVSANDPLVPYSATFARGDVDSVTKNTENPREACSNWWAALATRRSPKSESPNSLAELFRRYRDEYFLVVASSDYVEAIQSDLISGLNNLGDGSRLALISSKTSALSELLRPHLVSTDARLVCNPTCPTHCNSHYLGRNLRGSIGVALAQKFLSGVRRRGFSAGRFNIEICDALAVSPKLFTHQRAAMSDFDLRSYIEREIGTDNSTSATRLLRKLRRDGYACEQKRFKYLYLRVMEEAS